MKKRIKRVLSLVMVAAVILGIITGCGNKQEDSQSTQSANSSDTEVSGNPITLNVEVFDRGVSGQPDLNNNYWTKYVNDNFGKKNNITVNYVPVIRTQEVDKLNVLMAAGQAPDICFTYDVGTIAKYVKNDGIYQLNDYLAKYGSDLTGYLGESVLSYGKYYGKQMVIPAKRMFTSWTGNFIRKDWLDKLGLPVPTNRDELYNVLVAFRDKNPGNVKGVIPWVVCNSPNGISLGNVFDSFTPEMSEEEFVTESGWVKPGNKETYKWLNKLYNEKLISPDFALDKTGKQGNADVASGKGGFFGADWDFPYVNTNGIYKTLKESLPDAELIPVDTFMNAEGKYRKIAYGEYGIFIMIPKTSKNPEAAIKYLNWMSNKDVIYHLQNGEEGVNHKLVNGIPVSIPQTGDRMVMSSSNMDYCIILNGVDTGDKEKNLQAYANNYQGFESDILDAYKVATNDSYVQYFFNSVNESNSKYGKTLGNMGNDMKAALIACKPAEFDKLYDKLVAEYMSAGGQAVQDENKKIYKDMHSTK